MSIEEWENWLKPTIESNVKLICSYLNDGDVFVDVGANTGLFTQMVIDEFEGKLSKTIMFEPVPNLVNECRKKFENNNLVIVQELALSDENTENVIYASEENFGYNKIFKDGMEIQPHIQHNIKCVKFSDWVITNNIDKVNFIKIDAEGHDLNVIYGMFDWLKNKKNRPYILFETNWYPDLEIELINKMCDVFEYSFIELGRDILLVP